MDKILVLRMGKEEKEGEKENEEASLQLVARSSVFVTHSDHRGHFTLSLAAAVVVAAALLGKCNGTLRFADLRFFLSGGFIVTSFIKRAIKHVMTVVSLSIFFRCLVNIFCSFFQEKGIVTMT